MLTIAFLIAGIFSFLVFAAVTIYRLVIQGRKVPDLPTWEPVLGVVNAILAMLFFSLGIYRSIAVESADDPELPTPHIEVTAIAPGASPPVILVPFPSTAPRATDDNSPPAGTPLGPAPPRPTDRPPEPARPTATPVSPAVRVTSPGEGATVSPLTRVQGTSQGVAPGQAPDSRPPWVYLLVRRQDGEPAPAWWVQPYPVVEPDGGWSAFVSQGLSDATPGTPFDICAIVSREPLPTGQRDEEPRALSRSCVSVRAA